MLRVFRHYVSAPAIVLMFLEAAVLFFVLSLVAAPLLGAASGLGWMAPGADGPAPDPIIALVLPASLVAIAVLCALGMYQRSVIGDLRRAAARLGVAFLICWPLLLLPVWGAVASEGFGRVALALGSAISAGFGGVLAARWVYGRVAGMAAMRRRVLVIGVGKRAARIEARLRTRHDRLDIIGYLRFHNEEAQVNAQRVVEGGASLLETARRLGAEEVVVAVDDRRGVPVQPLLDCRVNGLTVTDYLSFWERETGQVMLEALEPSWLIYSDGFRLGSFLNASGKRVLDILVGAIFLVAMLPLMLLTALAIRLDSPGPVFYTQERVGWRGRTFTLYKFRSMRVDAERDGVPQWAAEGDPRVTRLGRLLRKTRLDEFPQVWNVLKGDMSFIGPRPERPFFVEEIGRQVPYYHERARVRPGITGWAQINYPYGASIDDAREKLAYDLYYIKNYSLMLDILVLLGTVQVVLWSQGGR